ncbi:MAG: hypothetical protein JKY61_04400 [Planctomycetes bacterium]|nr:hypothetical protein [Planctomycetota bacterium]
MNQLVCAAALSACLFSCSGSVSSEVITGPESQFVVFESTDLQGQYQVEAVSLDGTWRSNFLSSIPGHPEAAAQVKLALSGKSLAIETSEEWWPDKQWLVFNVSDGEYREMSFDTNPSRATFTFGPQGSLAIRSEIPNSQHPAIRAPSEFYLLDADGRNRNRLGLDTEQIDLLGWSESDAQMLVQVTEYPSLQQWWHILDGSGNYLAGPMASLEGPLALADWSDTHLAFSTPVEFQGNPRMSLQQYEKANGQVTQLLPVNADVLDLGYSSDSQFLAVVTRTSGSFETLLSFRMDLNSTFTNLTSALPGITDIRLHGWTDSGNNLAYSYRPYEGGPEFLRISDGLGIGLPIVDLGVDGSWIEEVVWSPDGRYLAFTSSYPKADMGEIYIHDTQSGQVVEQGFTSNQMGRYVGLTWAPDSHMFFAAFRSGFDSTNEVIAFFPGDMANGRILGENLAGGSLHARGWTASSSYFIPTRDSRGVVWIQKGSDASREGLVYSDLDPQIQSRVLSSSCGQFEHGSIRSFWVR